MSVLTVSGDAMITDNTVFIVGAGASNPYGYPIGTELRLEICDMFPKRLNLLLAGSGDIIMESALPIVRDALSFCQRFRDARIKSIDRYLAINPEFSEIGKLAIVLSILDVERRHKFDETLQDNWYFYLYNRMVDGFRTADSYKQFGENKISFITFNYDRSLENFFFECLKNTFHKATEEEIVDQFKNIPIHHVYGQVDELPWQGKGKAYGSVYNYNDLQDAALNIKTMYERTESENNEIKEIIARARFIYFLGFGYDKNNMEIIGLPDAITPGHRICGTFKNAKQKEISDVVKVFRKIASHNLIHIVSCGCVDLLREYT
jgi:hypothetical protein